MAREALRNRLGLTASHSLRTILRAVIPDQLLRSWATRSVARNQDMLAALARSSAFVALDPVPPPGCGGDVDHYYHFLFDLVLPLGALVRKTSRDAKFVVGDCGIYTDRLTRLFPDRVFRDNDVDVPETAGRARLVGMNPKSVDLGEEVLESVKSDVCTTLEIDRYGDPDGVLLIERLPPDPYFVTRARIKGAGASRRSIRNHDELTRVLHSMVKAPLEFRNVRLEEMPLAEQIRCFDRALVVIGQHGAGLANCIWMRPRSTVIELGGKRSLDNFRIISRQKSLDYHLYRAPGRHLRVDVDDFSAWILGRAELERFFRSG